MRRITSSFDPRATSGRVALALALTTLLSAGCATATKITPPKAATAPAGWSRSLTTGAAASVDLARWWTSLGDSTLTGLVEQALANNLDVKTARSRLVSARAQRNLAQANLAPSVSGSVSPSASKRSKSDASASLSTSIDASWELDLFGGLSNAVAAAQADVAASEEDVHKTQVSLAAEVATNYVNLRGYQARLAIAQANLTSQRETLQLTEWRAQAGLVGSVDVEQARANLAQTEAQVPSLQTSITQTEYALAVLLGLQPTALVARLDATGAVPNPSDSLVVAIPAESLRQRPDVRAAEQRVIAETARLGQRNAARFPSFSLRGSLGTESITGALTGGSTAAASLAASIVQTIFDAGRIRQQIAIQAATQEQAVITYEATVLTALQDVENALVSIEKTRQRLVSLTTAVEASRNAALLAQQQYSAGLADFQKVLDTQRTVLSSEDTLANAQVTRVTGLIQLYKALGGGWSQAAQTATSTSH